ncbi:tyrosine-type recombinase/integrase [Pseudopedobacter beijingensis]|uniref:Tyrosine-type recombinase/integrase n=1 Tax=Pseudopedobacter beijingensis TaxID=1207056 RepID=A0ABW4IC43_9SPHI
MCFAFASAICVNMYTEPKIITNTDLTSRSYILYYYNGIRCREYNGNKLGVSISPNSAKSLEERNKLLINLQYEFDKALKSGWCPIKEPQVKVLTIKEAMKDILSSKLSMNYSSTYKRDLQKLYDQFNQFFPKEVLCLEPKDLKLSHIESFLDQFKSSNRHYMNKRSSLSVFFSDMIRKEIMERNLITRTLRAKAKSVLHETFTDNELSKVLEFLKEKYSNLYLCCLLTYGCFLRPHKEVRMLKMAHFYNDFSEIHLSGDENKSGRIRTVFVPSYVTDEIKRRFNGVIDRDSNLFTRELVPYNDDYFKTQWSRAKTEMIKLKLIRSQQTLYSFRHTGAVNVYKKCKDLHVIQKLLGHSDMIVTLNYLRGLGEVNDENLRDVLPEL